MYLRTFGLAFALAVASVVAAQPLAQKSVDGGVTVVVTPTSLEPGNEVWTFKVVFDTHSQDLSDDVAAMAVLSDGAGREAKAIGWEGASPGGHHREGVLAFPAFDPVPETIELRISRAGESTQRLFRWEMK